MNHIYRTLWNEFTRTWVAVAVVKLIQLITSDVLRRMQFLTNHTAQCGFDLLARHGLMQRLIDERLVAALTSLRLEECND